MNKTPVIIASIAVIAALGGMAIYVKARHDATPFLGRWSRTYQGEEWTWYETETLLPNGTGYIDMEGGVPPSRSARNHLTFQWHRDSRFLVFLYPSSEVTEENTSGTERYGWSVSDDGKSLSLTSSELGDESFFKAGTIRDPFTEDYVQHFGVE